MKTYIKSLAKRFGYEVLGAPRAFASERSLMGLVQQEQINLVLDVGANVGRFATDLRACGYTGRIISYEPLPAAHASLKAQAENDPNWTVADRSAVGATTGSVILHIAGNSESSSILDMLPSHTEAEPLSACVGSEIVPVSRLDDLYTIAPGDNVLLKIDVQGYEKQVLDGAPSVLNNCRAIVSELSVVPLYLGQPLAAEMWGLLTARGFEIWSLEPVFRDPRTGRLLQFDGTFVTTKLR